eukprot:351675-Chlamydomonas_euryale.AAC.3
MCALATPGASRPAKQRASAAPRCSAPGCKPCQTEFKPWQAECKPWQAKARTAAIVAPCSRLGPGFGMQLSDTMAGPWLRHATALASACS